MTDVSGRIAFITGGANGIGLGIARSLARAGAKLALADVDVAALARAKAELQGMTQVETYQLDVRDRIAYASTADEVESRLGPVSLLFNNAGVLVAEAPAKINYDLWDFALGINVNGVINGVQTFLRRMVERRQGGHIVNTASGAGLAATTGSGVLYCTTKYAVVGMSEALNVELRGADIGVSVLCPGPVATGIVHRSHEVAPKGAVQLSAEHEKRRAGLREQINQALQQGTSPDTVGEMVLRAVRENRLYIHTDRFMEEPIKARTQALLAALP
ncbi:MAG TPA: SDR family NAD(P)-dependent oxidoreductase [Steroidobacter sp.]|uniref:SDR family oxidoreductase n=1 Tax=Steroidobacter sp. TaxID=1978227 RepID=UPI002EDA941C